MLDHLHRLAAALDARPAELVGLVVLLAGGLVTAVVVAGGSSAGVVDDASGVVLVEDPAATPATITVHVAGAVRQPGIVELPAGTRVADAIAAVGGARSDAVLDVLNLAALVEDGERIVVPAQAGERSTDVATPPGGAVDADGRVDLNRATAAELEELPGIGPVLAARILAWRDQHGPFREAGQLREVPGIGERTFQALADQVRV